MICIWSSWCHCLPIISCIIKIQSGLTFLVLAYPGCPRKKAVRRVSACMSTVKSKTVNKCFNSHHFQKKLSWLSAVMHSDNTTDHVMHHLCVLTNKLVLNVYKMYFQSNISRWQHGFSVSGHFPVSMNICCHTVLKNPAQLHFGENRPDYTFYGTRRHKRNSLNAVCTSDSPTHNLFVQVPVIIVHAKRVLRLALWT